MPSVVKSMCDQMERLVRLLLTNPASGAEAAEALLVSAQIATVKQINFSVIELSNSNF
jgi:hypothetical protein